LRKTLNPDPVALADKIDVAIFVKPFLQGVSDRVLGLLSFGPQNRKLGGLVQVLIPAL
jgi:hypothetical protein